MSEQTDPNAAQLQAVDNVMLTPLVYKALDRQTGTITNWNYQPVWGGFGGGAGGTYIYRFTGDLLDQGDTRLWTLILKIVHPRLDEDPASTHYWKRELEVYQSKFLDDLPGHFRAVRCFGVIAYLDQPCWIWLEELQDAIERPWPLEVYSQLAYHLGQFNGAYLTTRSIPTAPWLSSGWLRKIAQATEPLIPEIHDMFKLPHLQQTFPSDASDLFARLWDEREQFLKALDDLPQTFAHQDSVTRNLFVQRGPDGQYETVAVDWAYVGQAAVGMDIAVLVVLALGFLEIDMADVSQLDALVYNGYLDGLRDSGWNGDPQQIRLGYTAAIVCKYIETLMIMTRFVPRLNWNDTFVGHSADDFMEQHGQFFRFVFTLADEVRALMAELE
jgi:hypothetical protein